MDVISYVNRINTWPEYVKMLNEKKEKEKQSGSKMAESRVLLRYFLALANIRILD